MWPKVVHRCHKELVTEIINQPSTKPPLFSQPQNGLKILLCNRIKLRLLLVQCRICRIDRQHQLIQTKCEHFGVTVLY